MITLLANALAESINKREFLDQLGWNPRPNNQKLIWFEPLQDETSFLIQTADVISNFFLNLIRYSAGDKSKTARLKAFELLRIDLFDDILDEIKKNFRLQNDECVCINDDLRVSVRIESEFFKSGKILYQ